ncbi:hypothetical protein ACNKHO_16135 [Shigella flexneri]
MRHFDMVQQLAIDRAGKNYLALTTRSVQPHWLSANFAVFTPRCCSRAIPFWV